jgi:gluconokinase
MSQGIPLSDGDRAPWLAALERLIDSFTAAGRSAILTCSALKHEYREQLRQGRPEVRFVYLKGSYELIRERLEERSGHYMRAGMLDSQFDALEEPAGEDVLTLNAALDPAGLVDAIRQAINK